MNSQKTKGQIEDYISKEATKFYAKNLGIGPTSSKAYILHDMIILRFQGKLLPIEENLKDHHGGIKLIKDLRKALHETTAHEMNKMIHQITHCKVLSSHSDLSTKTGEIIQIYILDSDFEKELKNSSGRLQQ